MSSKVFQGSWRFKHLNGTKLEKIWDKNRITNIRKWLADQKVLKARKIAGKTQKCPKTCHNPPFWGKYHACNRKR